MRNIIFSDAIDSPLSKGDTRVVNVPFLVRLPTFEEAQLIHARISTIIFTKIGASTGAPHQPSSQIAKGQGAKLTCVSKIAEVSDLAVILEDLATEYHTQRQDRKFKRKKRAARRKEEALSAEQMVQAEEEYAANTHPLSVQLLGLLKDLVDGGDRSTSAEEREDVCEAVLATVSAIAALEPHDTATILNHTDNLQDMHSALHFASECGAVSVVEALLLAGSDPGARDGLGRTPYFVARDKSTRESFRRCRGVIEGMTRLGGCDRGCWDWDWSGAGVGPAINVESEATRKQAHKEKEKEKKKRAKKRKQDIARAAVQQAADFKLAEELQEKEARAEAERVRLHAGECAQCGNSLYKVKIFPLQDCKCCSAACVLSLRRKFAAEAAEKRFGK